MKRLKLKHVVIGLLLGMALFKGPGVLLEAGLTNYGLVSLLETPACDPAWYVCREVTRPYPPLVYDGNQATLEQIRAIFEFVLAQRPNNRITQLHLAAIEFALGRRQAASEILPAVQEVDPGRSPLVFETSYAFRLVQAQRELQAGQWQEAVGSFRAGLAQGGEQTIAADERGLALALGRGYQQQFAAGSDDAHAAYLAGKYLIRAGLLSEGIEWLQKSVNETNGGKLQTNEAAWAFTYLGQAYEASYDVPRAIDAFRSAIELASVRQAYAQLIQLLRQTGQAGATPQIEQQLLNLGPTYRIGKYGEGYQISEPARLANGQTVIGYDLDEEALESTHSVDLLVWWSSVQPPASNGDGLEVGPFWLERQSLTNLFPNAGFEWGVDSRGIPFGQSHEYYGAPDGSLMVEAGVRENRMTHLLVAQNSPTNRQVALVSKEFPVDTAGNYLMAGWLYDEDGFADLGWMCSKQPSGLTENLSYIAMYDRERPTTTWIHVADVSTPILRPESHYCQTLVTNIDSTGRSRWDNILLVQLNLP